MATHGSVSVMFKRWSMNCCNVQKVAVFLLILDRFLYFKLFRHLREGYGTIEDPEEVKF